MAFLSNQWLKPIHTAEAPASMPVQVSIERNYEHYSWVSANDVVATFRMRQTDGRFEVLALGVEDVDFLFTELCVHVKKETRRAAATALLKELGDQELVAVLSEVFAPRVRGNAV